MEGEIEICINGIDRNAFFLLVIQFLSTLLNATRASKRIFRQKIKARQNQVESCMACSLMYTKENVPQIHDDYLHVGVRRPLAKKLKHNRPSERQ